MKATTAVGDVVAGESGELASAAAYRPHLDGLRAVAVYLVVLFHAGSGRFQYGFVGVDVFFVLSGFLVTQVLLRDISARGSIRFGSFYSRRFRRLLPAAFVALAVTALVTSAIATPSEVTNSVDSFKAAFLYSANWYFIVQATGYFGADLASNPVLHFWSLAVEEQFYLVWPLAIGGAFALTRRLDPGRRLRAIRVAVAIGALASAALALSLRASDLNRAYYGTDSRAYELLAGALIALAPDFVASTKKFGRSARFATVASLFAIVVLASYWLHFDQIERGIAVTIATCVFLVASEVVDGGAVKRFLSSSVVVYLGKISYGTYLWHWLVIVVATKAFSPSPSATAAIACLVATSLASLSYEVLERPVRTLRLLDRHRAIVIATGLGVSVVSALVLIPVIVDPDRAAAPAVTGSKATGFTPIPAGVDWRRATDGVSAFINCFDKPAATCTVVRGTGRHFMLIGDSNARMFIPTFIEIARRERLTLSISVKGGCPWQRGLYAGETNEINPPAVARACAALQDDLYTRVIPALHPDSIVAVNFGYETDNPNLEFTDAEGRPIRRGSRAERQMLEATTRRSVAALRADGRRLVIIEPLPSAPFDTLSCISKAKVLEECRFASTVGPDHLELLYRQLARQERDVSTADLDRLVCPFLPICDPVINGDIVMEHGSHLAPKFGVAIAPTVTDYFRRLGVIPR